VRPVAFVAIGAGGIQISARSATGIQSDDCGESRAIRERVKVACRRARAR